MREDSEQMKRVAMSACMEASELVERVKLQGKARVEARQCAEEVSLLCPPSAHHFIGRQAGTSGRGPLLIELLLSDASCHVQRKWSYALLDASAWLDTTGETHFAAEK